MQLLTGLIGFSPLAAGTSGLDVADAPGVTAALALAIDAAAVPSALALWQKVERRAALLLLDDLQARLALPAGRTLPLPTPRTTVLAAPVAGYAAGVVIEWQPSPAPQRLYLLGLKASLVSADPVAVVKVIDLLDGQELKTGGLNLAAGATTVPLDLSVAPRYGGLQRTFVGLVTTSDLRAVGTTLRPTTLELATPTIDLAAGPDAAVSVVGAIGCDLSAYLTQHTERFAVPLWHLCAAELLSEKLNSPRTNWLTLHDPKAAAALRDALREAYERGLQGLIDSPPGGGPCASCAAGSISYGMMLP